MNVVMRRLGPYIAEGTAIVLRSFLLLSLIVFLIHTGQSLAHPYPLDYGEAPLVDQAVRLSRWENIYRSDLNAPPYTVTNYPPLYPLILAPLVAIAGPTFAPGRIVSIVCSLVTAWVLGMIVHTHTKQREPAWTAGLLFLAIPYVVQWAPLARVDMLALALSLGGLLVVSRWTETRWARVLAAGLLTAAVYTRQSYGLAAPLAAFVWIWHSAGRAKALRFAGLIAFVGLGLLALLNAVTRGGFFLNVVIANANAFEVSTLVDRAGDLLELIPLLIALAAVFLMLGGSKAPLAYLLIPYLIGATLSAATIGKIGSNVNYLLEFSAAVSLVPAALLAWLPPSHEPRAGSCNDELWRDWLRAALLLALALQTGVLTRETLTGPVQDLKWRVKSRQDIDRLALAVSSTASSGYILADEYAGLLTLQGRDLYLQPFEMAQLTWDGHWDPTPLIHEIRSQRFPLVLIHHFPQWPVYLTRWTPEMLDATVHAYIATDYAADTVVFQPRQSDEVYAASDTVCPNATWALPSRADFGMWWYSRELWLMGEGIEGTVPVYAVAAGSLLRYPEWRDAVAIRHTDPLNPEDFVWTFYGDMASGYSSTSFVTDLFPPGSEDIPVHQGQLLGYQGQRSSTGPIWAHLRFAVVPAAPDGSFPAALVGYARPDAAPLPFDLVQEGVLDPSIYLGTVRSRAMGESDWLSPRCQEAPEEGINDG